MRLLNPLPGKLGNVRGNLGRFRRAPPQQQGEDICSPAATRAATLNTERQGPIGCGLRNLDRDHAGVQRLLVRLQDYPDFYGVTRCEFGLLDE